MAWVAGTISVRTLAVAAERRLAPRPGHGRGDRAAVRGRRADPGLPGRLAARTIPSGSTRRGRARPGAVILVRLGADQWLLGGAAGERPDPGAAPDLVLDADPLAFVLRAAGRTRDDPWTADGDRRLLADVAATLSSVS